MKLIFIYSVFFCIIFCQSASASDYNFDFDNPEAYAEKVRRNLENMHSEFEREHVGIEILVSAGTTQKLESLGGHAFIRFVDKDSNDFNDTIVSFGMLAPRENLKLDYAFKGGAANFPEVGRLLGMITQYLKKEKRSINRILLPTTPELILKMKAVILDVASTDRLVGDYNFLKGNCLTAIYKILNATGYPIAQKSFIDNPGTVRNFLQLNGLLFYPEMTPIEGANKIVQELKNQYQSSLLARGLMAVKKSFVDEEDPLPYYESSDFLLSLSELSDRDLSRVFHFWPQDWSSVFPKLVSLLQGRDSFYDIENFLPLKRAPLSLYHLCGESSKCQSVRAQDAKATFGYKNMYRHLKDSISSIDQEAARARQLVNGEEVLDALENGEIVRDLRLFLEFLLPFSKRKTKQI